MFVIKQSNSYMWPVKVEFPVDDGKFAKQTFDAEFKRMPESRVKEIAKLIEAGEMSDLDLAKEVLVGWKDITDGENDVVFSEAAKEKLLEVPLVSKAIIIGFFESLSGAKRKN